jgi:hypothetical protein
MEKAGVGCICFALALAWISPPVQALDASSLTIEDLRVGGYTDFGRFQLNDADVKASDGEIVSRLGARWRIDKESNENVSAKADLHWLFWRNQTDHNTHLFHITGLKFDADLQAALTWKLGEQRARLGLYDFKYNPDAHNLGEYLLRSEAYPTLLESSQGKDLLSDAHTRIAGVEYSRNESQLFRHTALLYAEQISQPVYDLTAAYIATFGFGKAEVGAGMAWARFAKFGQQDSNTTMHTDRQEYVKNQGLDTEAFKLTLRARVELLSLPRWNESLVVYGEAALLGTKSDSLFYKDVLDRVPMMAGVSIPTAGILTQLSVEGEYFRNPYYGQRYLIGEGTTPLPVLPDNTSDLSPGYQLPSAFTKDDWRWSVLAHRAVNRWLDVKVRAASDHLRLRNYDGDYNSGRPLTQTARDWYFMARIEFHN